MNREKRIIIDEEEEEDPIQIGGDGAPSDETTSMCLIGKLWTERSYNSFALMETMKKLWCLGKGMVCRDLGNNMIAFQFNSVRDLKKIQDMEPQHFNKHMLVLKKISKDIQPSAMKFNTVPIWVRIYDLPLCGKDIYTIQQIGSRVGDMIEIDNGMVNGITISVQLKVEINLEKPLKRGIKVRIGEGEPSWLPITYARLSSFCYYCGKLGHNIKDCEMTQSQTEDIGEKELPYGDFLRASLMKITTMVSETNAPNRDTMR